MAQITIVGLGPGPWKYLTREALDVLGSAHRIYARTSKHPVLRSPHLRATVVAFDDLDDREGLPSAASQTIAERILDQANRSPEVVYAVPGSPFLGDQSVRLVVDLAAARGFSVQMVAGISMIDLVIQTLRLDPLAGGITIVDTAQLVNRHHDDAERAFDPFSGRGRLIDPTKPVLLTELHDGTPLGRLRDALEDAYPVEHSLSIVVVEESGHVRTETVPLGHLETIDLDGASAGIYVAPVQPLADLPSFDTLRYIVARLRAPDGCPWDREQTHHSMKKHLIEETYEAIAALDENDVGKFAEELGDVMLQVVMHCQLGLESRSFSLEDVLRVVNEKLIRRHPHVFGDIKVSSSADVLRNWEKIKRSESASQKASFSTIPESMPALMRADAVQSRATRYGWTPPDTVPDLSALDHLAAGPDEIKRALGECLFDLVTLARRHGVDAEEALRLATNQFAVRLQRVLDTLQGAHSGFDHLPPDERRRLVRRALEQLSTDELPKAPPTA